MIRANTLWQLPHPMAQTGRSCGIAFLDIKNFYEPLDWQFLFVYGGNGGGAGYSVERSVSHTEVWLEHAKLG